MIQIVSVFFATLAFAILLEAPKNDLPFCALVGSVCQAVIMVAGEAGCSSTAAAFIAAVATAALSNILARVRKAPVTVFLIPGIIPIVPGAAIYYGVYFLMLNDSAMSSHYFLQTLQTAGAIAMAVFIVDSLVRLVTYGLYRVDKT